MAITINGTTGLAGVDGSAGTPAVQGADTNTGMFFPAADTIAFSEGGAEVMRIDSSGNVGVGTSSIAATATTRVEVNAASSAYNLSVSGSLTGYLYADASAFGLYGYANVPLLIKTNNTERMRIDSRGNLLVNKTTAQTGAKLSVVGGISGTITSSTAVASTSGTSIDFTGIPSWVKRITVMLSGVSTNGTSIPQIQLGDSGGVEVTGYVSGAFTSNTNNSTSTTGFLLGGASTAAYIRSGNAQICLMGSNLWSFSYAGGVTVSTSGEVSGGNKTTTGTLDRVRITTVNGTDTFDAGSINILYEG